MAEKKWTRDDLIAALKAIGCGEPESWADSQLREGIFQLHRFAFLRALWSYVVRPDGTNWVNDKIDQAQQNRDEITSAAGPALERMLKAGVAAEDIVKVVRAAQAELLFEFVYHLDDSLSALARLPYPGNPSDVAWSLFAVDDEGNPMQELGCLHESVIEVMPHPEDS